jgi:hypothetical protein
MTEKKKAILKDDILKALVAGETNPHKMADTNKVDSKVIRYLCEELADEKLLELTNVTMKDSGPTNDYLLRQTNKTTFFLTIDGGFIKRFDSNTWQRRWTVIKVIVAVINALTILAIGFYSVYLSDKTDKLEKENEQLRKEIQMKSK